jgi:hypothetical protein
LTGVLLLAGTFGCADNDLTLSILQMEAVMLPSCVAVASMGATTPGRSRGLLDLSLVKTDGYIGVPVVRNNLMSRTGGAGSVEFNSIQITGANVTLQLPAAAAGSIAPADRSFFYAAAPGRIDPGGSTPMFIEVLPAKLARQLASSVPKGGLLTVVAEIRPVGDHSGDQVIGGPIFFPIDICTKCLVTIATGSTCPLPVGTTPQSGGCFPQQDDPVLCCASSAGTLLCGTSAIAKM